MCLGATRTIRRLSLVHVTESVTPEVRTTDPDGLDYGWVMQMTFITTIFLGTPVVTVLSVLADLPTWPDRATFAIRVGAVIWLVTLISVYLYARNYRDGGDDGSETPEETAQPTAETTTDDSEQEIRPSPRTVDDDD